MTNLMQFQLVKQAISLSKSTLVVGSSWPAYPTVMALMVITVIVMCIWFRHKNGFEPKDTSVTPSVQITVYHGKQ
jgi:hypothetical protein